MNINLKRASLDDAGLLFEMQRTAFMPLLEKYRILIQVLQMNLFQN